MKRMAYYKAIELRGRGISFEDAADKLHIDDLGRIVLDSDTPLKKGVLHVVKKGDRAVPVIRYDGESKDTLCAVFQIEQDDGSFQDADLQVIADTMSVGLQSA